MINDKIRVRELRLVGDNVEPGIYPIDKARQIAAEQELDLVVISDKAEPLLQEYWNTKNSYTSKRKNRRNLKLSR